MKDMFFWKFVLSVDQFAIAIELFVVRKGKWYTREKHVLLPFTNNSIVISFYWWSVVIFTI